MCWNATADLYRVEVKDVWEKDRTGSIFLDQEASFWLLFQYQKNQKHLKSCAVTSVFLYCCWKSSNLKNLVKLRNSISSKQTEGGEEQIYLKLQKTI